MRCLVVRWVGPRGSVCRDVVVCVLSHVVQHNDHVRDDGHHVTPWHTCRANAFGTKGARGRARSLDLYTRLPAGTSQIQYGLHWSTLSARSGKTGAAAGEGRAAAWEKPLLPPPHPGLLKTIRLPTARNTSMHKHVLNNCTTCCMQVENNAYDTSMINTPRKSTPAPVERSGARRERGVLYPVNTRSIARKLHGHA